MSIEYQSTIDTPIDPHHLVIDLCEGPRGATSAIGKQVTPSLYERVIVQSNSVYQDIVAAYQRLLSMKSQWIKLKVNQIYIYIHEPILKYPKTHIEHILCKIINIFLPETKLASFQIIVTHAPTSKKSILAWIQKCVMMSKKTLAARIMAMLPPNIATPETMTHIYKNLFEGKSRTNVTIYSPERIVQEGFRLIHGVGDSSNHKPYMVVVERQGKPSGPTVAFVGKGITFDSGGLAIKSLYNMQDMKYDKIGAVYACAAMLHFMDDSQWDHVTFIGVFPFAENAISDKAYRPGDVITSYIGKTVEITNPDAEGRLVMADAFGYLHSLKNKPNLIIDIATLTGHAESISCWHSGYYYAFPASYRAFLETYSDEIGERMIPMPTWGEYRHVLQSPVADISNSPVDCGDAVVAAMFLKEFLPKETKAWLHIDLAHETDGGKPKGGGIRTMIGAVEHFLSGPKSPIAKN